MHSVEVDEIGHKVGLGPPPQKVFELQRVVIVDEFLKQWLEISSSSSVDAKKTDVVCQKPEAVLEADAAAVLV